MKWIGALLFTSLTTWIGFKWSDQLEKRPRQIRMLKTSLQILEAEMLYSQLPLQEAFISVSNKTSFPINSFFKTIAKEMKEGQKNFYSLWDEHIQQFIEKSALKTNEYEILKQFGQTLGQHDFTHQQKQIHLTTTYLDRELEEAHTQQVKYGNMARLLGVLAGLFIVILLI